MKVKFIFETTVTVDTSYLTADELDDLRDNDFVKYKAFLEDLQVAAWDEMQSSDFDVESNNFTVLDWED